MQHPRGIADAARIHRHIDNLLLNLRQETGIGICQEKRPSTPKATRTAPIALLAFRHRAMSHNIGALAVGAVEHWRDHRGSLSYGWFCFAQIPVKDSRSTDLKHLPFAHKATAHVTGCTATQGRTAGVGKRGGSIPWESPSRRGEMGLSYLICWCLNYPFVIGTGPTAQKGWSTS